MGGERSTAHALELGSQLRTSLANAQTPCLGALLGYALDTRLLGVRARLGFCTPFLAAGASINLALFDGFYLSADANAETHFFSLVDRAGEPAQHRVDFALRAALFVGTRL